MFEATKIIHQNNDWITLILIFIFIVLVIVNLVSKERLSHGNIFFLSKKYLSIYFGKGKPKLLNLFQIALFIVQLLTLSLLLYLANLYFQVHTQLLNFKSYILIVCGVGIYFLFRYLIGLFIAFLFNFRNQHGKIVYHKINYLNNLVLWILPLLIFSIYATQYQKTFLEITFVVFVLLLVLRYSLILLNNKKLIFNNLFYFILYLCALEIAPLIIVLKLTI
tara:strand:- start:9122 stop:9784 length:663 start_codon:yes stop_codon:yes gene_type:complete